MGWFIPSFMMPSMASGSPRLPERENGFIDHRAEDAVRDKAGGVVARKAVLPIFSAASTTALLVASLVSPR